MRKASILIAVLALTGCTPHTEVYPTALTVISTAPFIAETSEGIRYEIGISPEDIEEGDDIAVIMSTNNTEHITDDTVIDLHYIRR